MTTQPPPPFDLGNLSAVKVGDEVTTLDEHGNPGSGVHIVQEVTPERVRVRRSDGKTFGAWLTKNRGGCPWAMHDQAVMRYYYSANPEHIARAKANAEAARLAEEARKAALAVLMEQARPIGVELGDGYDSEEGYQRETAAQTLAANLTPEQMRTLAGWLRLTP